ncbi:ACBD5 family protein [Megaselia abdita]
MSTPVPIEDKFNAAVNVIKNLPKNGSYQPSTAMMLKFYSYFKQGTIGPCRQKKPPFWDIVGKTKWDSWSALGDMSKEKAMQLYVDELRQIIETMSFNENVADFVGSLGQLEKVDFGDLETVAPEAPIIKMAHTHPDSPYISRANSPSHGTPPPLNGLTTSNLYFNQNGHSSASLDQSDEEYIDTVESHSDSSYEFTRKENISGGSNCSVNHSVLQEILATVQNMNADLVAVNNRMQTLEKQFHDIQKVTTQLTKVNRQNTRRNPHWWPFRDISPTWFVILVLWPFLANRLNQMLQKKK